LEHRAACPKTAAPYASPYTHGAFPKRLGFWYRAAVPTVFRFDGLLVTIYLNDHRPAHVHVIRAASEAVFDLHCPDGPPSLRENLGFNRGKPNSIATELAGALAALCAKWRSIHGD
jgi:hypothetical protein